MQDLAAFIAEVTKTRTWQSVEADRAVEAERIDAAEACRVERFLARFLEEESKGPFDAEGEPRSNAAPPRTKSDHKFP